MLSLLPSQAVPTVQLTRADAWGTLYKAPSPLTHAPGAGMTFTNAPWCSLARACSLRVRRTFRCGRTANESRLNLTTNMINNTLHLPQLKLSTIVVTCPRRRTASPHAAHDIKRSVPASLGSTYLGIKGIKKDEIEGTIEL